MQQIVLEFVKTLYPLTRAGMLIVKLGTKSSPINKQFWPLLLSPKMLLSQFCMKVCQNLPVHIPPNDESLGDVLELGSL